MSLDIYVGPLARFYTGRWSDGAGDLDDEEAEEALESVAEWAEAVADSLAEQGVTNPHWPEDLASGYTSDRPGWDAFNALVLWAAYAAMGETPPAKLPSEPYDDKAYKKATATEDVASRQLLREVELWLPGDFDFTFDASDVFGEERNFGSSPRLLAELDALNAATWKADAATIAGWRKAAPPPAASLEAQARFAFAIVRALAAASRERGLPMILDY